MNSITDQDILAQVSRICEAGDFKSKNLLCRFLHYVVEETIAGRGDRLKGYRIGIDVLGKDVSFDPEQDSLVRIHAGRLRRLLKLYYLEEGRNDPVRIEIPKGAYQPFFYDNRVKDDNEAMEVSVRLDPSVAVLPFINLTGDPGKDYFAHGFSEEIAFELARYKDLRIISCWKRPETGNLSDLYINTGARFIIDGSLKLHDQQIMLMIKLIDSVSGIIIWSEKYLRDLSANNLLEIEADLANEIARVIGSEFGLIFNQLTRDSERIKPENMDVFNAILSFYYYEAHQSADLMIKTFGIIQEVFKSNPGSGILHAMLSTLYGNAYALDAGGIDEPYQHMIRHSEKAIELDPHNQLIKILYCFKYFLENDKAGFLNETEKILRTNLYSAARLGSLGFHMSLFGEWERGKEILDKAMSGNTGYPLFFHGATCLYYYRNSDFEKAYEEALKYDIPGLFWCFMLRGAILGQMGRTEEASIQINHLKSIKPQFEGKAKYLISRFVKEEDLTEHIINGLEKAGMCF